MPTAAAANSFQAGKGATGVIGHNLVDSLIYKQSLMKFLVFINNVLQPRAALAPGVGIGTRESHHPRPLLLLLILRFPSRPPPPPPPLHRDVLRHPLFLPCFLPLPLLRSLTHLSVQWFDSFAISVAGYDLVKNTPNKIKIILWSI